MFDNFQAYTLEWIVHSAHHIALPVLLVCHLSRYVKSVETALAVNIMGSTGELTIAFNASPLTAITGTKIL